MYKTSDIERFLRLTSEEPVKRRDIIYAKEHRWSSDARRELVNVRPTIVDHLIERGVIEETSDGCKLTTYGSSLQELLKEKHKEGASNIELIPVRTDSEKISYGVRYRVGSKYTTDIPGKEPVKKTEIKSVEKRGARIQTAESSEETGMEKIVKIAQDLKAADLIKGFKETEGSLVLKTKISFHRTKEELRRLDRIVAGFRSTEPKMMVSGGDEFEKRYRIEGSPITIVSSKKMSSGIILKTRRGFGSYENLKISIDPTQYEESSKEMIKCILERLKVH